METIYKGQEMSMNIGKTKNNYDKERRLKYFNCNKYGHMAKECQKKKKNTRKYFRYERVGCYDLKSLEWNKRTNSCIGVNTRELDKELFTK